MVSSMSNKRRANGRVRHKIRGVAATFSQLRVIIRLGCREFRYCRLMLENHGGSVKNRFVVQEDTSRRNSGNSVA
ncbi:MAG TPA: hypothetical protein VG326_19570 [Tepidisphaeraceae bacterium]|nr:hypothetical protein [Tepidisphaeraceae bacterium]